MIPPVTLPTGEQPYRWDLGDLPLPDDIGKLRLVVGGFPRTSTTWLARALQSMGIAATREGIFPGNCNLTLPAFQTTEADVSGFAGPFLPALEARGVVIVHLLRHPVDAINSTLNAFPHYFPGPSVQYWDWMTQVWWEWQSRWGTYADATVYFERRDEILPTIKTALQADWDPATMAEAAASDSPNASTAGTVGTWDDLPEGIQSFARAYGYRRNGL